MLILPETCYYKSPLSAVYDTCLVAMPQQHKSLQSISGFGQDLENGNDFFHFHKPSYQLHKFRIP